MRRGKARGFTIIEMVIVIAVVMVLMVLFWPCVNRARPAARTSYCLSNLKQIGLAAAMYAQDYDETLFWNPAPGGLPATHWAPAHRPKDCSAQPSTSFVVLLLPYARHSSVFRCPSYPGYPNMRHLGYRQSIAALPELRNAAAGALEDPDWTQKLGYGFNELLVGEPCRPPTVASLKHRAADVALLADATEPWASGSGAWVQEEGAWTCYWELKPGELPRHGTEQDRGQNFVFVDGHAKFLRPVLTGGEEKVQRGYYPGAKLE